MSMRFGGRWWGLIPAYGWLILFCFVPLAVMFVFSFLSAVPLGAREVSFTFNNYATFFQSSLYSQLTLISLTMAFQTTFWCLLFGYPLAWALSKAVRGRTQGVLFLLIVVPFWSNSLIRLYSWVIVLQNGGVISQFFKLFGISVPGILFTYPAIIIALVHAYLPYMVLTIYVSLDRIDDSLIEASRSLGARAWRTFRRVILPLSMPGVVSGVILVFVPVVGAFVEPRLLGGRQSQTLGTIIENQFVNSFNWTLGSALSFLMLFVVLLLVILSAGISRLRSRAQ